MSETNAVLVFKVAICVVDGLGLELGYVDSKFRSLSRFCHVLHSITLPRLLSTFVCVVTESFQYIYFVSLKNVAAAPAVATTATAIADYPLL